MTRVRIIGTSAVLILSCAAAAQPLPPVPIPAGNPITEPKRVLGKILFWDEQLSADNTVACATCHLPQNGGGDPRRVRAPGVDGVLNTPDDIQASPGVIRSDEFTNYLRDAVFGLQPQVTTRTAQTAIMAAFSPTNFWDGRAGGTFIDPQTGAVVLNANAALESQAVGPPVSGVEMGHDNIDWNDVIGRLTTAKPLALATAHTTDMAAALADDPTYPVLFQRAFGDTSITASRIAMAIATYERTLIANDTPWDRFVAGQANALTPAQQAGLTTFNNANCNACHVPPLFTGNGFRNIGIRPPAEDLGRFIVTNNVADRGRFKVPTLRNVGLKFNYMHNGQFNAANHGDALLNVVAWYARQPGSPPQFGDNLDPIMNTVRFPPQQNANLVDFLRNGLTDARVRNGVFPFDRPTLYSQRAGDRPVILAGTGTPGTGGVIPVIIANTPPMVGNERFKIGLDRALPGAAATLVVSSDPPVNGVVGAEKTFGPMTVGGSGIGLGFSTAHWPLINGEATSGEIVFAQWVVSDPSGAGGVARSNIAQITFFCPSGGCTPLCPADFNASQQVTVQDIFDFLASWNGNNPATDFNGDGSITVQDIYDFLFAWNTGC